MKVLGQWRSVSEPCGMQVEGWVCSQDALITRFFYAGLGPGGLAIVCARHLRDWIGIMDIQDATR